MEQKEPHVRLSARSNDSVTITGFIDDEVHGIESMMLGLDWARIEGGRIQIHEGYLPLPDPIEDKEMLPFWSPYNPGKHSYRNRLIAQPFSEHSYPSITIQHLCGYNYTPENYAKEAEKLTAWGFVQMRSKRDESGHYFELWFLSSLLFAQGALADAIKDLQQEEESGFDFLRSRLSKTKKPRSKLGRALRFLQHNVEFGTLDVSSQRMAMVIDD